MLDFSFNGHWSCMGQVCTKNWVAHKRRQVYFCFKTFMKASFSAWLMPTREQSPTPHSAPRSQYLSAISFLCLHRMTPTSSLISIYYITGPIGSFLCKSGVKGRPPTITPSFSKPLVAMSAHKQANSHLQSLCLWEAPPNHTAIYVLAG